MPKLSLQILFWPPLGLLIPGLLKHFYWWRRVCILPGGPGGTTWSNPGICCFIVQIQWMHFLYSNPNFTHAYLYRFPLNLDRLMLPSKAIPSHSPEYTLYPWAHVVQFGEAVRREEEMNSQLLLMTYSGLSKRGIYFLEEQRALSFYEHFITGSGPQ